VKTLLGAMTSHLGGDVTTLAMLWKIVRTDGVTFHFTTHDQDILFPAGSPQDTYLARGGFNKSAIANQAGMNVDDLEVMAFFSDDSITVEELRAGLFDGASVYVSAVNYANIAAGAVALRRGWLGEMIATPEGLFKGELRGLTEKLQSQYGQVYAPECRADLGDARCTVNLAALTANVTITQVIDRRIFVVSGADTGQPDDYYAGGLFTFTSGPNAGRSMEIVQFGAGSPWVGSPVHQQVTLYLPVGYMPEVGNTGTMSPGCNKTTAMCLTRFNNILNFRGEPYLPGLDAMMLYPDAK
jgi:uncharacterized phage protein (TIGR02218 family)